MADTNQSAASDTNWQQQFQTFERALAVLTRVLVTTQSSEVEKLGQIQAFEFTFELAWHVVKDYLAAQGMPAIFPQDVFKKATECGVLVDSRVWLDMIDKRELMEDSYDAANAAEAVRLIRTAYYPALQQLQERLAQTR